MVLYRGQILERLTCSIHSNGNHNHYLPKIRKKLKNDGKKLTQQDRSEDMIIWKDTHKLKLNSK